jgi:hypothetical protein
MRARKARSAAIRDAGRPYSDRATSSFMISVVPA